MYHAMNKGIRHSNGDVLFFLNADDYFADDDVVKDIAAVFNEDPDAELVFGKQIAVVAISRDTAGLAICQVSVDGRDVSAALVAAGAAWADPATGTSLTPEQQEAQQGRKGLWAEDNPQPPWEFRETGNAPWQPSA